MMFNFKAYLVLVAGSLSLASCGQSGRENSASFPDAVSKPQLVTIRSTEVSEANGWKQIVPGYWTKTEQYMGGPLVSTYIDNSVRAAVEYEIQSYEQAKSGIPAGSLQQHSVQNDSYADFLRHLIEKLDQTPADSSSQDKLSALFTCTASPSFSVGPYNNGSRVGIVSYVSGSCTSGGRASAIAKYNGVVSNIYDADGTQSRIYSATADATRYTLSPAVNSATDCGEARMGSFSSTVKRHWGNPNDCINYN